MNWRWPAVHDASNAGGGPLAPRRVVQPRQQHQRRAARRERIGPGPSSALKIERAASARSIRRQAVSEMCRPRAARGTRGPTRRSAGPGSVHPRGRPLLRARGGGVARGVSEAVAARGDPHARIGSLVTGFALRSRLGRAMVGVRALHDRPQTRLDWPSPGSRHPKGCAFSSHPARKEGSEELRHPIDIAPGATSSTRSRRAGPLRPTATWRASRFFRGRARGRHRVRHRRALRAVGGCRRRPGLGTRAGQRLAVLSWA